MHDQVSQYKKIMDEVEVKDAMMSASSAETLVVTPVKAAIIHIFIITIYQMTM